MIQIWLPVFIYHGGRVYGEVFTDKIIFKSMLPNFKKIPGVNQEGEQTQRDIFFWEN